MKLQGAAFSWGTNGCSAGQEILYFYGTQRYITMFTTSHHWNPSWARWL